MMVPITQLLGFIQSGFQFLSIELSALQLENLMMIGNGLLLGSKFNLSEIHRLWLKKKSVNAFSHFLSHAKLRLDTLTLLYHRMLIASYGDHLKGGRFIIDDTMEHHSKLCQYIHGVFAHFDHALGTHLKAKCLVFLYYQEAGLIKFPIGWRIYYKGGSKSKNELALELIEVALGRGFPGSVVLADSWYCVAPFIKGLRGIEGKLSLSRPLIYVMELKPNLTIEESLTAEELPIEGRLQTPSEKKKNGKSYRKVKVERYFQRNRSESKRVGFGLDLESGKAERTLYKVQRVVAKIHAFPGKHVIIRSFDVEKKTIKYLISNELTWEGVKVIHEYSQRWVIEEFFRDAKQLLDMEGACIRSEQGVAIALFLVTLLDALLHLEVFRHASENPKTEPITVQSIIRLQQIENIQHFIKVLQDEEQRDEFLEKWVRQLEEDAIQPRRKRYQLVELEAENVLQAA
jgi:hypothetical protein